MKLMTSQLSINEGQGPRATKPVGKTEEITALDEEAINLDQAEKEILEVETTATGTANSVTSAKSRVTDKRNAIRG
jgi:hypothetical protein